MKNAILKLSLLATTAFASSATFAATYYISDCQSGASSGCVAGNDSNAGTSASAPWRTTGRVVQAFGGLSAGDKLLFAKGGSWTNASMTLQNLNTNASNPIVIDSYTPSSGASARPILTETRSGYNAIGFDDGSSPEADGGYVVQNLELRGNGSGQWGVFTSQLTSDITLNNLVIDGFAIGLHCGTGIQRVKLLNSTLRNNRSQGTLSGCSNSVIEGNTYDNNGYATAVFDHSIYIGTAESGSQNITIRNNTLRNSSVINGKCESVAMVVHGVVDGLVIEGNKVIQGPDTSSAACWGIAVDGGYGTAESFKNVKIRGNTVVNVGGVGIGCSSCIAPVIENNVIVMDSGPYLIGIAIPDRSRGSGDAVDTGGIVRNNSIYFAKASQWSQGVSVATNNGSSAGNNLQVVSNLVYFGSGSSSSHSCFDTSGISIGNFTAFNNNLCFHAGGNGTYSPSYSTLTAARAAGFDTAGLSSDPKLAVVPSSSNNWSMALTSGSPAINAGHSSLSSTLDKLLSATRSAPDIGAFEYRVGGTDVTPPASPTSVMVQ